MKGPALLMKSRDRSGEGAETPDDQHSGNPETTEKLKSLRGAIVIPESYTKTCLSGSKEDEELD
ncbi:hypothetical protein QJS10_CPA01g01118 [Acorus calamus]|uniref:Uncharacterized protein n=1 Tax=Acorus calamus TaxID=4465 RepID=A0AAV9FJG4_ACOCL|nr:hypothetical protein QJS10_CPA01g01118 [Acorus calamus]